MPVTPTFKLNGEKDHVSFCHHFVYCHLNFLAIQHYVKKFVGDLRQGGGFLRILWFPPLIKLTAMI
jgi:hypothetical protein